MAYLKAYQYPEQRR